MLKIHHLGHSQSERIVWLCEELALPYEIVYYTRDAVTRLSPPELRAMHPLGAAPVLEDDGMLLAESAAIVEYIIVKHGGGRLSPAPNTGTTRLSLLVPLRQRQSPAGDRAPDDGAAQAARATPCRRPRRSAWSAC